MYYRIHEEFLKEIWPGLTENDKDVIIRRLRTYKRCNRRDLPSSRALVAMERFFAKRADGDPAADGAITLPRAKIFPALTREAHSV